MRLTPTRVRVQKPYDLLPCLEVRLCESLRLAPKPHRVRCRTHWEGRDMVSNIVEA
jgi:hypothetical protein